jgi:toxin-antitoxin system PIN domain toxin
VTILDANILLYAYNQHSPQQSAAQRWLTKLLESNEAIAIPWVTIWAFLRIATNSRIWAGPLTTSAAFEVIHEWLQQPGVVVLQPGPLHAEILGRLLSKYGVAGSLVTDAVLAALAVEHGATLASTDQDFRRFSEVRWVNPVA